MKFSLMFAKSLIFPKTEKKSSARRSLFGAMLCIGLSIVPLLVVVSISDGMISGMTERIIGLSSNHIQAYVAAKTPEVKTPETFKEYISPLTEIKGITAVYPEVDVSALAAGKNLRTGIELRGVEPDIFTKNKSYEKLFAVCEGQLSEFIETKDEKLAVIGKKMAEDLELHAGDSFRIITTKNIGTDKKIAPKLTSFTVAAVITSGYQELDQFWVFVPMETVYKSISMDNASYNVMIETQDAFSPDLVRIQRKCKDYFGKYANVYRWDDIHKAEFENFSSTKVMLVFVMMMIVLVASVNISSAIVMLVMERQKEIAILKSLGAKPKSICFSFLMAGMACGFGGLLFGLPLGMLITVFSNQIVKALETIINFFTRLIAGPASSVHLMDPAYYLSEIPVKITGVEVLLIICGVLLLSVLVSYIPARKAGKEKPLDILRKN